MAAAAAALPPLLHSVWWNHRDPSSGTEAYPHVAQYNQEGWGQRWRRRAKRQAENTVIIFTLKTGIFYSSWNLPHNFEKYFEEIYQIFQESHPQNRANLLKNSQNTRTD